MERPQSLSCLTLTPVQDLTTGSLTGHLLKTTSFMLVSMVFQTLYVLIDLYWVGRLGTDAVAAVGLSGNLMFIVLAATQMLGVGTTTLVSHATGSATQDARQPRLQPVAGARRSSSAACSSSLAMATRQVCTPSAERRRGDAATRRASTCCGSSRRSRCSSA